MLSSSSFSCGKEARGGKGPPFLGGRLSAATLPFSLSFSLALLLLLAPIAVRCPQRRELRSAPVAALLSSLSLSHDTPPQQGTKIAGEKK